MEYEGWVLSLFSAYKDGARHREHKFALTIEQFVNLINSPCHYCGRPPYTRSNGHKANGIDRVMNRFGYTPSNCVPCCKECNYAKGSMDDQDFIALVERIHNYQSSGVAPEFEEYDAITQRDVSEKAREILALLDKIEKMY